MGLHARLIRILFVLAAIGVAVFFALGGDGRNGYWVNHPRLASLVSGAGPRRCVDSALWRP
jgi:hypothetical protein